MRSVRSTAILRAILQFWAPLAIVAFAQSAQSLDPQDLLGEVAAAYRSLNSFEWTALYTVSTESSEPTSKTFPLSGAFRRPHSMRLEWDGDSPPTSKVSITDGKGTWILFRQLKAFCRPDSKSYLQRAPHDAMSGLESSLPYEHILDGIRSAALVGNSILRVGGAEVNCVVVRAVYGPSRAGLDRSEHMAPITYWIDTRNKVVVQQSYSVTTGLPDRRQRRTQTISLTGYKLNPELPDAHFKFRQPPDSRELPCSSMAGGG